MELIALVENTTFSPALQAEHGLSFLVKLDGTTILFDTGQSERFIKNAKAVGEDLRDVDFLVLSHGHYDHTGGLRPFLDLNHKASVFMKREALQPKYSTSQGRTRDIACPLRDAWQDYRERIAFVEEDTALIPSVQVVTGIPSVTGFENRPAGLLCSMNGTLAKDPFYDELFLAIRKDRRLIILTGCSHRGIVNILLTAKKKYADSEVALVAGGFHLKGAGRECIQKTIDHLKDLDPHRIGVCHCTGIEEFSCLREALGDKVFYFSTGDKLSISL